MAPVLERPYSLDEIATNPFHRVPHLQYCAEIVQFEVEDRLDLGDPIIIGAIECYTMDWTDPSLWPAHCELAWCTRIPFKPHAYLATEYQRLSSPVSFTEPELPSFTWPAPENVTNSAETLEFGQEHMYSLLTSIGWALPTQTYDDYWVSTSLIYWQGYEMIHNRHFPIDCQQSVEFRRMVTFPNFLPREFEAQSQVGFHARGEIPTIQEWNEEFNRVQRHKFMEDPKNASFLVQSSFILDLSTREWMYDCLLQIEIRKKLRLDLEGFRTDIYDDISYVTDSLHDILRTF
jgi:hypothetical protein